MKYTVTGGLGFIGSNIVKALLKKNHDVTIIDNVDLKTNQSIFILKDKISFFQEDIKNKNMIKEIIKDSEGVFHNAALIDVQESYLKKEEYFSVNVLGTKNIFETAKKIGIKVVYASSASIYGNTKIVPIKENFKKNPTNPYGQTKLDCENIAKTYSEQGLKNIGLRYFNVYGIGQTSSYAGVITKFVRQLKQGKPPIIFGNGSQIRDFIHVSDIAEANISAMESNVESDFFNIGSGKPTSILELARLMIKISRFDLEPIFKKPVTGDVELSMADINHAKKIKWKPKISLEEGLQEIIK
jgi:UDP-glucose 4-epimerase